MEYNYCRRCGTALTTSDGHAFRCAQGHHIYANASPTVGIFFLTADNQIILSVRGIEPDKGMLDSFGGFLDGAESFEDAAARELVEELSLNPDDYEPLRYLTSGTGKYDYDGETVLLTSVLFWSRLITTKQLVPSDDVAGVKYLPLHEVDVSQIAGAEVRLGIRALQKLFTTDMPTSEE